MVYASLDAPRSDRTPSINTDSLYHIRSTSIESDASSFFQLERSRSPLRQPKDDAPRLHLDPFFSHLSTAKSATPSPRSPEGIVSPIDEPMYANGAHAGHARYASQAHPNGNGSTKVPLKNMPSVKKSMPDLRPTRLHLPNGAPRAATHATDHFPRSVKCQVVWVLD